MSCPLLMPGAASGLTTLVAACGGTRLASGAHLPPAGLGSVKSSSELKGPTCSAFDYPVKLPELRFREWGYDEEKAYWVASLTAGEPLGEHVAIRFRPSKRTCIKESPDRRSRSHRIRPICHRIAICKRKRLEYHQIHRGCPPTLHHILCTLCRTRTSPLVPPKFGQSFESPELVYQPVQHNE